ncbi:MAG: FecR family protein [Bacteroidota bacterium]
MRDLDSLALYDALPPDEQAAVAAALAEQPALAEAFARWRSLRADVRVDLAQALPDRALLVLYALADDDLLSVDEQDRLEAVRPDIEAAVATHPGLAAAVRRIQADRDAFEQAWAEAASETAEPADVAPIEATPIEEETVAPRTAPRRSAPDRSALRASQRPTRWVWRAASVLAVVAFAAVATYLFNRDAGWETITAQSDTVVTLPDGSTADLAAGATLMVPEAGAEDARQARLLGGGALFRIEHDAAAPFTVTTLNARVAVLGTTFAVEAADVETEVVLVAGAVEVASDGDPEAAVRLEPGQRTRVLALDAPEAPVRADLGATLAAVDAGAGETAEGIAALLGERFGVSVAVDDALAHERLSVAPSGDDAEAALDALARALGARLVAEGDAFRIAAR